MAGIGGFSGRESDVSVSWLAQEVRSGRIRWVLAEQGGARAGPRLPGDTRTRLQSGDGGRGEASAGGELPDDRDQRTTGTAERARASREARCMTARAARRRC